MKRRVVWGWVAVAALVVAAVLLQGLQGSGSSGGATSEATSPSVATEIGFRNQSRLDEHFAKHGREFGAITKDQYLRRAQELRDRPEGGAILELVKRDGVITRYDRDAGSFIAVNPDRTIRTFFRPNDGEEYFRRQARR